ncbi:MAG: PAS domain S-box protein, partial [Desulfobacteraceae bacterium]
LFDDFVARLPEEDQSRFLESVDEAIDNIKPWHYEGRFIKPSGKEIWFESHSMPRKVGERIVFYGILIDASLRKQLEEDLRLTRSIFDKAPIGIWRMGETGEVLDVNEKGRSSLGYVIEELCGMMVFDFTLGFDKEDWETGTENLKKYGVNNIAEVYLRHKNGEIIPVQVIENLVRFEDQAFRIAFALDISERQRMEQALKESEERLDLALSSANEGIWDWHIQEEKVFFDSRYYTMAGYEPNEFPGSFNEWEKRVHKDDLERARSDISRYLAGDIEKFDTEFRFVRKDGSFMWIQAKGKIVSRDDRNNPVRFIGTHADISDRKLSEIALNKTLTNLSNSQKLAKVGSFEWDVIKGEVEWSDEVYRIFGRNRDNFKPKIDSIMNQLHPDDRKLHETLIEQALSNREKYSFETRIIMPDDDTRFLAAVSEGHYDENGNVIGITGTVQDITDRKHAESALLKSEERLRLALDGTADGIWDYDPRTGQAYFSPRYYTMMGYEPGEFLPTYDNWRKLVHPDDVKEAEESINRALEKNASFAIEFRFRTRNGDWRWILGRGKVVDVDPEGKAARVAGSHTDITDRKRMAEALEKRIVALTQPLEDAESIAFEDLFNLSDIQHLQDLYAEAFGVAALITHPDGTPITEQSNFTVLCGEIIRKTPKGIKNCNYSDAMVGKHNPAGPNIQPCLSAGLCNAGASITVGGRHIANWLIGQVRDEAQKEEEIMAYAREIGADEAAFRAAYHQVPTMSEEQFEKAAKVLFTVTKQLSMSAYQNIQQARFITQRKRAEQALRENEQLLVNIVESMNEGVVMLDREFNYKLFNNYMEELSDTPRQKVFGKKPWEAFPDIKKTGIFDNFKKAMKGERIVDKEIHFTFPHKKDEWLKDSFIPLKDTDGSIIGVLHIAIDITRQKQDEEELRRLRNYLSNIIDSMPSILVAVDKDGKVTQWNNQSERITGLSFEDVRAQPLVKVFPRLAEEIDHIRDSIRESRVIKNSKIERNEDKEARFEDVTIFPLVTNGVEGAVIRVDDITEQVRLEEMMIQSEKMLSVGGLAAGMAHEINNPLAGMMQTAEVMANRLKGNINIPANRKAAEAAGTTIETIEGFMEARGIPRMLDVITDSGKRIATIVNNMLSFARKSEATFSFHILEDLLDKTAELAATDYDLKKQYDFKKIDIRREYAGNLPQVPCDGAKIQQVLLNILRNGAQAMQAAGIESPCFIFRTRFNPDKDMVIIEIEDNGPGMDDETRKRVFEPFFTTKPVGVGTGLGLSVSYFIITENHGGEMAVEASSGTGAKFIIRLPVKGK